ncbi:AAA family ATPase [Caulobacter sp. KR2-114]|uniref:AAA family ATPase n=1 Tax=Caulobacter sp. KR2-114 TaxID=3400912 RepID=UPI003C0319D2
MSDLMLQSLDVTNFRSIRGHIHAPLDAQVVLVHGENGAGKTSLLSALELALTGEVQSLQRADPGYARQLLHRSAEAGSVGLRCSEGSATREFGAILSNIGAELTSVLPPTLAAFFRERTFLPQSLLGQLLQIYQDAGNEADSPLARFVGKLLGLDRLDRLEAGLKPFNDVRNVRKNVDGWLAAENEKIRLERLLTDTRKARAAAEEQVVAGLIELANVCTSLELQIVVDEGTLAAVDRLLLEDTDQAWNARLADQQRRLAAIRREIAAAQQAAGADALTAPGHASAIGRSYQDWAAEHGQRLVLLRQRVGALLPTASLPSDPGRFASEAISGLRTEAAQHLQRAEEGRADVERDAAARTERDTALRQRTTIDDEVSLISTTAGSLGSALSELTALITDEVCPVCDRDFSELHDGPLSDHVHGKVRLLSASAERLLTLGRSRTETQVKIEALDREIEALATRIPTPEGLADLDRQAAAAAGLLSELEAIAPALAEGAVLLAFDVAERRRVTEAQSRSVALAAARDTLSAFALEVGAPELADGDGLETAAARLEGFLSQEAARLETRLSLRRRGGDHVATIRSALDRRQTADAALATDGKAWSKADGALNRAQRLRDQANAIRGAVDDVRSGIIRREFNDRLNRLWRDLFVRLAPNEPFVPAFRIPAASTQRLQPKLITEHRDGGDAGGTPGAMLSAGNLNTAALTLFIALHLSVPRELPWLVLDDPVQSMDDVHIAHFAALLRTLSKEHGRQVFIAVHDRQLFEYLKLELSPAFPEDSLLTLELSRGPRRDTLCVPRRLSFKEETALATAA